MGLVTVLYVFVKVSLFLPQWVEVRAFSISIVFSALSFEVLICSLNVSLGSKVSPSILGLRIVGSRVLSSCSDSSSIVLPCPLQLHCYSFAFQPQSLMLFSRYDHHPSLTHDLPTHTVFHSQLVYYFIQAQHQHQVLISFLSLICTPCIALTMDICPS